MDMGTTRTDADACVKVTVRGEQGGLATETYFTNAKDGKKAIDAMVRAGRVHANDLFSKLDYLLGDATIKQGVPALLSQIRKASKQIINVHQ